MNKLPSEQMFKKLETYVVNLASQNNLIWFYKLHQKEVVKAAKRLLESHPDANIDVVIISCWLHDISKFHAQNLEELSLANKDHHLESAKIARNLLKNWGLSADNIKNIESCIIRHRNSKEYPAQNLEEKIVAVADTLSHFANVFYLTYFKFSPEKTIDEMVADDLEKIERDWRDLKLLPGAQELVRKEYEFFKQILLKYKEN